jgi:EmrB/QacA subfamily drug resistance transporter
MIATTLDRPLPMGDSAAERFRWGTLLVVLAGTFMTFLDFFIVNVALPSMQAELHAGQDAIELVVAGYGVAFAVGMISGGRMGDLYGRRRMFAAGLLLFIVTSLACGLAPNAAALVLARVLQGASGALLTPQVLAILGTVYTGAHRARAFAAYGMAMGFAGVLGQLLGGALIQADIAGSGWRGVFLINVPVGVAGLVAVRRTVPESHGQRTALDVGGATLLTAGLVALVLPLVEGRPHGWPEWTVLSLVVSPVLLAGFAVHQVRRGRTGRAPLVDFAIFGNRAFSVGSAIAFSFALVPPSLFFVLALYLQQGRDFSALFSGEVFAAVGAGFFAALLLAVPMAAKLGRQVLAVGSVVVAAGCLLLADAAYASSALELVPGLAVAGFGIGTVLVPVSNLALTGVVPHHAGAASGMLSTAQQVGGALGVAVTGIVFFGSVGRVGGVGHGNVAHAFARSLVVLAVLTAVTAALVQLLPRPQA